MKYKVGDRVYIINPKRADFGQMVTVRGSSHRTLLVDLSNKKPAYLEFNEVDFNPPEPTYTESEAKAIAEKAWCAGYDCRKSWDDDSTPEYGSFESFWQSITKQQP